MVPIARASVRIAGSGASFPTCRSPEGETVAQVGTVPLFERLTPEMTADRRAPILAHLLDAVGIESRAWARWPGTPPLDGEADAVTLAADAGRQALADAKLSVDDLGFVLVATSTPPRWTAATSSLVAGALGANCGFLDVRSGCAGGLYAIALGATLAAGSAKPVLVIGTDTFSKVTPHEERFAVLSMGDGAGALVIAPADPGKPSGLRAAAFGGDGANHHLATVPGTLPPRTLDPAQWVLAGDPEEFSKRIEAALGRAMDYALGAAEVPPTLTIVHASRRAVCRRVAEKSPGPVFTASLEQHGSLGAASVAIALHEARAAGLVGPGATVAIASAGGGPSWGGAVWTEA